MTLTSRLNQALILAAIVSALVGFVSLVRPHASVGSGELPSLARPVAFRSSDSTVETIDALQRRLRERPSDQVAQVQLGLAYLQRSRETADPAYYPRAEEALRRGRELEPADSDALLGLGMLALARHQFAEALSLAEQARRLDPDKAAIYGVIGDAQVELGRYDEAVATVQRMVDLRPDRASYARVSYLRELHGDLPGAVEAMRLAVSAGPEVGESGAWPRIQLGLLLIQTGNLDEAESELRRAQTIDPGNPLAEAGLGRVRMATADFAGALPYFERAVAKLPLPDLVVTLAELHEATGRSSEAAQQLELARSLQALIVANGGNVDAELALFEAERGDPVQAASTARNEVSRRQSIHAYDALAWALYNARDYPGAREASVQALRLGTQDSLLLYHSAMIDLSLGDRAEARAKLSRALQLNPGFSAWHAPTAQRLLEQLEAEE